VIILTDLKSKYNSRFFDIHMHTQNMSVHQSMNDGLWRTHVS